MPLRLAGREGISTILGGVLFGFWLWSYPGHLTGNDTGGMIAWSPDITRKTAQMMAEAHCDSYGKAARITSFHGWAGDYVGFRCRRPGSWGPRLQ
jgi:hypothetical protein